MDRTMYGKVVPGTYYPFRCAVKEKGISPGYALLADLQNSINPNARLGSPAGRVSSPGGRISSGRASSPGGSLGSPSSVGAGYGSINGTRNINVEYEKKATPSPTYQNTGILREKTPPAKSYSSGSYASTPPSNTGTYGRTGKPAANLSELDTLLDDLSNARYAGYAERNTYSAEKTDSGYGRANGSISPAVTPTTPRPTVDSLLDQLSTDVHNGGTHYHHHHPSQPTKKVVVTVQETVVEPADVQHLHQHTHPHQHVVHTHVPHASNATKELDDLMASLSDFKVSSAHHRQVLPSGQQVYEERRVLKEQHSTGPNHQHESLEYMLGSLKEDMSRQGVQTPQKGCCNACDKPIVGQVITALGRTWHPEHFTCAHCQQELGTRNFFERDGKPYCEPDYHNLFSPRCAYCNGPILDKCVTALDKTWHTEHFFCAQCGQQFGEDGFHERDGKPYCRNDYFDMFAPKCGGCNRPIMENYISALNLQWHPDCFVCKDCHEPFHGGSFYDHEGYPYCETHYHAKRGSLCAGCHKPIAGRCVTAMFRKFHPEHFVCAFCLKQLNKGTFKEQNDKPYCHVCFDKLFG